MPRGNAERVLAAIERGLLPVIPPASVGGTRDPSERRAVVACILRVGTLGASSGHGCDTSHSGSTSTGTASGRTAGPMRGREHSSHLRAHAAGKQQPANVTSAVAESPLDVFFILRASRRGVGSDGSGGGGGRWSGQVAFPGGHVEIGETDHDAVVREVREEVGLDLRRRGGYRLLGEVTPRSVSVATGTLVLRCMVFLQMDEGEATVPDPNEVAAAGWAPLSALTTDEFVAPLGWSEITTTPAAGWDHFPSVHLPMHAPLATADGIDAMEASRHFRLWGLTLRIVNDFLSMCGIRMTPIDDNVLRSRF